MPRTSPYGNTPSDEDEDKKKAEDEKIRATFDTPAPGNFDAREPNTQNQGNPLRKGKEQLTVKMLPEYIEALKYWTKKDRYTYGELIEKVMRESGLMSKERNTEE